MHGPVYFYFSYQNINILTFKGLYGLVSDTDLNEWMIKWGRKEKEYVWGAGFQVLFLLMWDLVACYLSRPSSSMLMNL